MKITVTAEYEYKKKKYSKEVEFDSAEIDLDTLAVENKRIVHGLIKDTVEQINKK
jgi:hypothetical protein